MAISAFELFKIGIGPSSSHTVGPMLAARQFAQALRQDLRFVDCVRVQVELFGSLGATGAGHGTPKAIILGLEGETPEEVDVTQISARVAAIREAGVLSLLGEKTIEFSYRDDLIMHRSQSLPFYSNGMRFTSFNNDGAVAYQREFYSVGGGFVLSESATDGSLIVEDGTNLAYPFSTADQLLKLCDESGLSMSVEN